MFSQNTTMRPKPISLITVLLGVLSARDISSHLAPHIAGVQENQIFVLLFFLVTFPVMSGINFIYDNIYYYRNRYGILKSFIEGFNNAFGWYTYLAYIAITIVVHVSSKAMPNAHYKTIYQMWKFTPPYITDDQKKDQDALVEGMKRLCTAKASKESFLRFMSEWFFDRSHHYYLYCDERFLLLQQEVMTAFGRISGYSKDTTISWRQIIDLNESFVNEIRSINLNLLQSAKKRAQENFNDSFYRSSSQYNYQRTNGGYSDNQRKSYNNGNSQQSSGESRMAKHFRILGVSSSASYEEVRTSYRKLMKENHPDRFHNASESEQKKASIKTQEITAAWEYAKDYFGKK